VDGKEKGQEAMKMVALKRGGCSRRAKAVWLIVLALALLTVLGGCAWIQNWLNPNHSPVAVISANPTSGEALLEVTFDASQSYDPDGDQLTYQWDFGDGKTGKGKTVQHTFSASANYAVRLTVIDKWNVTGTASVDIMVTVETKKATIGTAGGTVTTSEGTSVNIPPGTCTGETQVSISELAEPPVQFKPGVNALANGVLVTLSESNTNPSAFVPELAAEMEPKLITVSVPLSPSVSESFPDKEEGFLLKFSSNNPNTEPIYVVTGMQKSGNTGKVSIPMELIKSLSENSVGNSTSAATPTLLPIVLIQKRLIIAVPISKVITHIPSQLYTVDSSSDFKLIGQVNEDGSLAPTPTHQSTDIIPIILIHGYKVLRGDEIITTTVTPASEHSSQGYAQTTWEKFIDYFNQTDVNKLDSLKPYHFELYTYRWDTDEGLDIAANNLANLIQACFGDRPFILIGHSAGGIVARACIEGDERLSEHLLGLITLASPHLGVPVRVGGVLDRSGEQLVLPSDFLNCLNHGSCRDWNYDPALLDNKLIVYGGYVTNWKTGDHNMFLKIARYWYFLSKLENDGIVPLLSSLASHGTIFGDVDISGIKQHSKSQYKEYDHFNMLYGKEGGSRLFKSICDDLQGLAGERVLPVWSDLTVSSVNLSTSSVNPGDNVPVTFTVQNSGGSVSKEFQNGVFLSTMEYGGQGGQKIVLGDFPMSLNGSNSKTQTVNVAIPQVSVGHWYIVVYTDCDGVINETNENNNINSAEISIESQGGPILPNEPPSVTITFPQDGSSFAEGDVITFQGSATDPEDGALTGDALLWYAAPLGDEPPSVIGRGGNLSIDWLSAGSYIIGLTAEDSQGATATDTITITIGTETESILFIYDYNTSYSPMQSITSTDRHGSSDLAAVLRRTFIVEERNLHPITLNELIHYDIVVFSFGWGAREITDSEASALTTFVQNGGGLLLVGEHGAADWSDVFNNSGDKVGSYFGVEFHRVMVCDPTDHYYDASDPDGGVDKPLITKLYPNDITRGVHRFMLSFGASLWVTAPATAVGYTDSDAWLDTNTIWHDDLQEFECHQDAGEATGSFPVLAISQYGNGKVVAIGDGSVFANQIINEYDNSVLAENIFEWLAEK
jgi:PKD repeat protein